MIVVFEVTVDNKEDQPWVKIAKKRLHAAIAAFRRQFADEPTRALEALIPAAELAGMVEEEVGAYRDRIYPPMTTLGLFIGQALSPDGACQDAVARNLSERQARGEDACSLNSGPYCKARQRLPLRLIERLAVDVGEAMQRSMPASWHWRARSVKLVDGTTITMSDTPANQEAYPQRVGQKPGLGFPQAMLVALISLSGGALLRWALGPCQGKGTGEQALFRALMPALQDGDLVLADRYYCTYFAIAQLRERGVDLVTRQHQARLTDFRRGKRLGPGDRLVQWQRPKCPAWMDEQTYQRMPPTLWLRQIKRAGRVLVTTLIDAGSAPAEEVDALYNRRWQVEVDLRSIKAEMGLDFARAKSPEMVHKEIAVHLLAYNLVCALMMRAAMGTKVLARALSFKGAVQLLLAFQQTLRHAAARGAKRVTAYLLGALSRMRLPLRPGRVEPHALKRRGKNHPWLTVPRDLARARIVHARIKMGLR
jgi:hypothetical protein